MELPDGKVLSGSEWGNMLLWDGGLIKVEISKKGKKSCHNGMIEQFFMDEGELMTIGVDGYVKVCNGTLYALLGLFALDPVSTLFFAVHYKPCCQCNYSLEWSLRSLNSLRVAYSRPKFNELHIFIA